MGRSASKMLHCRQLDWFPAWHLSLDISDEQIQDVVNKELRQIRLRAKIFSEGCIAGGLLQRKV